MGYNITAQSDGPRFDVLYETSTFYRKNVPPDELADALFEGGVRRSFKQNVLKLHTVLVREGEWVTFDAAGDLIKALPTRGPAWPVWQDPGAGRTDVIEGGVTLVEGRWVAITNMIDDGFDDDGIGGLQPGDELKVGALGPSHEFAGAQGLVPVNDAETGTFLVVAIVEAVLANGFAVVSNVTANYPRTVNQVLTSLPPTTAAPTTAVPTTVAPTAAPTTAAPTTVAPTT